MSLNWEGYTDVTSDFEAYGDTILMSIECLMIIILIIIYIKYFCLTTNKIDRRFNILLLVSLILTLIYIYNFYILHVILSLVIGLRSKWMCFILTTSASMIVGGQRIAVYVFFLLRLYDTFKGSVFEIKKQNIVVILVLLIISLIPSNVLIIIISYLANTVSCHDGQYWSSYIMGNLIGYSIDILWSLLLTYMYVKRLKKLIEMINTDSNTTNDKVLYITKKLTLLALITITTSFMQFLYTYFIGVCAHSLVCLDLLLNITCVMLSFVVLDKLYKKYCCCCIKIQNQCYGIHENQNVTELAKQIKINETSNTSK